MTKIIVNHAKCQLITGIPLLKKIIKKPLMSVRVNGAFYSPAYRSGRWDGKMKFITEKGMFDIGKLPQVIEYLEDEGEEFTIQDERDLIKPRYVINKLKSYTLRPIQKRCQLAITKNKVRGIDFPIGFIKAATNTGKTLIAASIHRAYDSKSLFIINSKDLLEEALREMPDYLGQDNVGYIVSGKPIKWAPFMIVMIKTAINKIHGIIEEFKEYPVSIVDEADLATSKTYTTLLSYLFHCHVRVGLSGTQFTQLAKDKIKREKVRALFGENVIEITNTDMIEAGYSSKVEVNIVDGNLEVDLGKGRYREEYEQGITWNKKRHDRILKRVNFHLDKGNVPMLIFCQYHDHINQVYGTLMEEFGYAESGGALTIDWIHHKRKGRQEVVKRFREGEIDILVGSFILKRGKNFPLTKYILNAGGGDSFTNVLQGPVGRAVRKHESKDKTIIEDMFDKGTYLKRHSKHRRLAYKKEGFKINDQFTIKINGNRKRT